MNLSPSEFLTYGWQTDDCFSPSQCCSTDCCVDLKENRKFHIEFFIDYDKSMISYFNVLCHGKFIFICMMLEILFDFFLPLKYHLTSFQLSK